MGVFLIRTDTADEEYRLYSAFYPKFKETVDYFESSLLKDHTYTFPASYHYEPMVRDLPTFYSLRVSGAFRFIFKVVSGDEFRKTASAYLLQKAIANGFNVKVHKVVIWVRDTIWDYHRWVENSGQSEGSLHTLMADSEEFCKSMDIGV